jgi:hypothetical protein
VTRTAASVHPYVSMIRSLPVLLAALALGGCQAQTATFGATAEGGMPPPLTATTEDVPRWDHYCAMFSGGIGGAQRFTATLDAASANGWEMVGVTTSEGAPILMCFKRPHEAAPAPADSGPPGVSG